MGGTGVKRVVVGVAAAFGLAAVVGVPAASAEALSPWWAVASGSQPTNLVSGEPGGRIVVTAENRGDASTSGEVTLVDNLPAGLNATGIAGVAGESSGRSGNRGEVSCVLQTLTCTFSGSLQPYEEIEVDISVEVQAGASSGEQNSATVSGGGAAGGEGSVSASHAIEVDGSERFGVEDFQLIAENVGGSADTQAGSHPFQLTSVVTLNTQAPESDGRPRLVALAREIVSELPAGLIANPTPLARCTGSQFARELAIGGHQFNGCPADTAVGVATVTFDGSGLVGFDTVTAPIFNMTPYRGEPARFGVDLLGKVPVFLETSIRSGGDYGVTLATNNIIEAASLLSMKLTFWGTPGDPSHDGQRGWECLEGFGTCTPSAEANSPPFLSLPSTCGELLTSTVVGASWVQPEARELEPLASYEMPALDGCNEMAFKPEIDVSPDQGEASRPTGLNVDVHVPQTGASTAEESSPNPESTVTSAVRDISVALPAGVAIDPAAADGLQACAESEIGFTGVAEAGGTDLPGGGDLFTPTLPEPFCPNAAKVGTVEISTPLLASPLEGAVYLAAQNANPFGSLLALYVVAEDSAAGTVVKLAGEVSLNPSTGQVTVTFEGTPQLPLEEIELDFFGGERALLATPALCGLYTTNATFTPWSGNPPQASSATFEITSGPNGSACRNPLPFAPSLAAGTPDNSAGSFTPLQATISRADGQQALRGFQLHLPPGLEGMLSTVPLCPEVQANAGACGQASQIGETTVSAGLGGDPYTLTGGRVYLTEGYEGAPFGLAIITPVKAGPLDLEDAPENHPGCDCLVIRAKIEVDPQTAQLTIATGLIPQIIDGVPLQIKDLNITINRSGFIFNPTSCAHLPLTSTISGNEGTSANVSSPFQVANCRNLKFTPKLTASTDAHAEALKGGTGASLNVRVVPPAEGPQSSSDGFSGSSGGSGASNPSKPEEANIKRLDLTLPKLLPARLQPTLQNACTKARFAKDPASCPPDSFVGTATATTPMLGRMGEGGLGGQLSGPAIFVSQGGAALPDLDLVLQGDGVEILVTGDTVVKGDVTYAKFETFPDVPISSFALTLPEGPHSALASGLPTNKHSLCGQSLEMPTTIEGQNGAVVKQTTRVSIQGCKPALYIRSTKVSGKSVTVTVTVPSAGKIVASGAGLSRQTKRPGGEKLVTLKLTLTSAQAAQVSKGHGLKTRVELAFTPRRGRKLTKSLAVGFG